MSNATRKIAIQWTDKQAKDNVLKLVQDFSSYGFAKDVMLFASQEFISSVDASSMQCTIEVLPDIVDNNSKAKNFILNWAEDIKHDGFLHTLEDDVVLLKDPS